VIVDIECDYCEGSGATLARGYGALVRCGICGGTGVVQRDVADEIEDWMDDCGMMPDGQCLKAGSEECEWSCPRNR
jgi:DnaJ-class molecular chaperone